MGVMAKIQGINGTSARNINRVSSSGLDTTRFNGRQLKTWKRYEMRNLIKEIGFKEEF